MLNNVFKHKNRFKNNQFTLITHDMSNEAVKSNTWFFALNLKLFIEYGPWSLGIDLNPSRRYPQGRIKRREGKVGSWQYGTL